LLPAELTKSLLLKNGQRRGKKEGAIELDGGQVLLSLQLSADTSLLPGQGTKRTGGGRKPFSLERLEVDEGQRVRPGINRISAPPPVLTVDTGKGVLNGWPADSTKLVPQSGETTPPPREDDRGRQGPLGRDVRPRRGGVQMGTDNREVRSHTRPARRMRLRECAGPRMMPLEKEGVKASAREVNMMVSVGEKGVAKTLISEATDRREQRAGHGHVREIKTDSAKSDGGEGERTAPPTPRWLGHLGEDKMEIGVSIDPGHERRVRADPPARGRVRREDGKRPGIGRLANPCSNVPIVLPMAPR
jgi:hypothetical protein